MVLYKALVVSVGDYDRRPARLATPNVAAGLFRAPAGFDI